MCIGGGRERIREGDRDRNGENITIPNSYSNILNIFEKGVTSIHTLASRWLSGQLEGAVS